MFAAIDFRITTPGLLYVTTRLFEDVGYIKPALQMSAALLSLGVFFIAGALPWLLNFYFVMRKLGRSLGSGGRGFTYGQRIYPRSRGAGRWI